MDTLSSPLTTSPKREFTVTCTARAKVDEQSISALIILEWTHTVFCQPRQMNVSEQNSTEYYTLTLISSGNYSELSFTDCNVTVSETVNNTTTTCSSESNSWSMLPTTGYSPESVLYHCKARLLNNSVINDTATLFIEGNYKILQSYISESFCSNGQYNCK